MIATENEYNDAPRKVKVTPILASDINTLRELTRSDKAPRRLVRSSRTSSAIYTEGMTQDKDSAPSKTKEDR